MQAELLVEGNSQWNFVRLYSSFDREAGGQANTANPMTREIISPINQMLCLADSWRSAPPLFPTPWRWAGCDELRGGMDASQNKALDFSKNRAEGDDILGDAYEYLMRHFATESGKYRGIGHLNGSWANIPQFPATPSSPAPSFVPGTSNLGIAASRRSIASVADMALTHPCTTLACPG